MANARVRFHQLVLFVSSVLAAFSLSFAAECENHYSYRVKIDGENAATLQKKIRDNAKDLGVTVDREARRMNSNLLFHASVCSNQTISELFRSNNIQDYAVEPLMKHSTRRMQSSSMDSHTADFNVALDEFDFDVVTRRYLNSKEIDLYVEKAAEMIRRKNPSIIVNVQLEGRSFERRPIKSITVQYGNKSNPIVFIDAGVHAREWHSRSLALYTLKQLIHEAERDTNGLIYTTTIIIVANVNPDGYEYSLHADNMWRKTRKPVGHNCVGVDGNRNYKIFWSNGDREGNPCEEIYRGERPFSESETRAVRKVMMRIKRNCFLYISIHTFGNTILYPYGYTTKSHNYRELLHRVASAGVQAVQKASGSVFVADQSGSNLYLAAGGSDDYAIDVMKIPFAYTLELGSEEFSRFALPENEITQAVFEGWTAIRAMIYEAQLLYKV